jgi:hypothetical protein
MKKNLIVLNLCLLGLVLFFFKQLRDSWVEYGQMHSLHSLNPPQTTGLSKSVKTATASDTASEFMAIVNNDLFVADRTNLMPPEPPPPPPPPKVSPPKPVLCGIFRIGEEESVLMISNDPKSKGLQKRVRIGELMDKYKLEAILDQQVVMQAEGDEPVEIRLNEPAGIVPRDYSAGRASPAPAQPNVVMIGESAKKTSAAASTNINSPAVQAPPPPSVPAGTIVNGKRKVVTQTPFGNMESWEDVK